MKKKLLVIMLLLITVAVLAIPTPALAWGGNRTTQNRFVATATIYVTSPGVSTEPVRTGPFSLWKMSTDFEMVEGTINNAFGWPAVAGCGIRIEHHSTIYLNYRTMRFNGTAKDTITVTNGSTTYMTGSYSAFISGSFTAAGEGAQPDSYDNVIDAAQWTMSGTAGGQAVTASGTGLARLTWTQVGPEQFTLAGPLFMSGTYK